MKLACAAAASNATCATFSFLPLGLFFEGDKKGSKKSKGPKSKQKKSMNLDGHYSSMSSHSQDDENQDNPVFKNASNCVKKEVRVTLAGPVMVQGLKIWGGK